jgi:hypothetical protein
MKIEKQMRVFANAHTFFLLHLFYFAALCSLRNFVGGLNGNIVIVPVNFAGEPCNKKYRQYMHL